MAKSISEAAKEHSLDSIPTEDLRDESKPEPKKGYMGLKLSREIVAERTAPKVNLSIIADSNVPEASLPKLLAGEQIVTAKEQKKLLEIQAEHDALDAKRTSVDGESAKRLKKELAQKFIEEPTDANYTALIDLQSAKGDLRERHREIRRSVKAAISKLYCEKTAPACFPILERIIPKLEDISTAETEREQAFAELAGVNYEPGLAVRAVARLTKRIQKLCKSLEITQAVGENNTGFSGATGPRQLLKEFVTL
jgi:hypothetical protein